VASKYYPRVGDKIEVSPPHRFCGEKGSIIAVGDNPSGTVNHFHIYFDRDVWGAINRREIWLGMHDFVVTERAPEDIGQIG